MLSFCVFSSLCITIFSFTLPLFAFMLLSFAFVSLFLAFTLLLFAFTSPLHYWFLLSIIIILFYVIVSCLWAISYCLEPLLFVFALLLLALGCFLLFGYDFLPWHCYCLFYHRKLHGSRFGNSSSAKFSFIGLYEIDTNIIHLLVLFEYWCCVHCLDMHVICLFILFKHKCCVSIHIAYIQKSCTWFLCLNNAWHLCVNDTNPWNNKFCMNLEWTHETYKFVIDTTTSLHVTTSCLDGVVVSSLCGY